MGMRKRDFNKEILRMKTYTLRRAAELLGVHEDTIRYWEKQGLIEQPKRDSRGWRYYTQADIEMLLEFRDRHYQREVLFGHPRRRQM
jgi:predicted site-specific integrase-resolvase